MHTHVITTNFMYKLYYVIYYILHIVKLLTHDIFVQASAVFIVVDNTAVRFNSLAQLHSRTQSTVCTR